MYKKTLSILIALITSVITSTAMANAKSGLALGIQGGYAKARTQTTFNTNDIKKGNLFYGATIGMDFTIMPMLTVGAETGIFYGNSLSKITTTGNTTKISNLIVPILAKVQLSMPLGFDIFAKSGISYVDPSAKQSGTNRSIKWNSSWNYTAAAGIGYQIGAINIFAQYMHIFGKDDISFNNNKGTGNSSKIDSITAGVTYTF